MDQNSSIAVDSMKEFGVMSILREAMHLPAKNKKLMLSAMLFCFIPNTLLLIGNYISLYPLLLNFLMKLYLITNEDPNTPQFFDVIVGLKSDAEAFVQVHMLFVIVSYAVSAISMMIIVHTSLLLCSGKHSTLIEVYFRVRSNLMPVLVTCIYFSLLYTGFTVLSVSLIAVPMLTAGGSVISITIGGLLAVLARLLSVYLAMVWMVGVVVSVAEDACFGLEALWRGGQIAKGRRFEGFFISLMLLLAEGVFAGGYGFVGAKKVTGFILVMMLVVTKLFSYVVYTVFYCHCRKEISYTKVLPTASGEMLP